MIPDHIYAVILAGGSGTRFWPKSRHTSPKQLCQIGSSHQTMLEQTLQRLEDYIPKERQLIVTHSRQSELTKETLGTNCPKILAEPEAKNTAAAIAMAAIEIERVYQGSAKPIMVSLHADALIESEEQFKQTIDQALKVAEGGYLGLIGIKPKYPETGYGYIETGSPLPQLPGFQVKKFKEKPNQALAEVFAKDPSHYWNSGIFVWQTSIMLEELAKNHPEITGPLMALAEQSKSGSFNDLSAEAVAKTYANLPNIAIDPALLEQSEKVAMVDASFNWQDVGSWDALPQAFSTDDQGNFVNGKAVTIDSQNNVIDSDGPLIACLGVEDLVVVASKGAILVCPKNRSQDVKQIVTALKESGQSDFT